MIALQRRNRITSIFKQSKIFGSGGGTGPTTQTLTLDLVPDPGDTIFVILRAGGTLSTYAGFTLLGSVATALYVLIRTADSTDTGTYDFIYSAAPNNVGGHAMVTGATLGYTNFSLNTYTSQLVVNAPSISIQKNSTILLWFSTFGNAQGATSSVVDTGYTLALTSGFNIQSHYKFIANAVTENSTITFSPGTGPDTTRIIQIEILGVD